MHIGEEMGCTHTHTETYIIYIYIHIYIYIYTDYIAFALVYTDPGVRLKIGYPTPMDYRLSSSFPLKLQRLAGMVGKMMMVFPIFTIHHQWNNPS